ncbi:MAG: SpvB/TcaC N-terminal domain-containing protein [Bacteroidia bacterium]|nr:SpvB/TcaC N-terminal domain-containing protein [Bacteroidia bacterium]
MKTSPESKKNGSSLPKTEENKSSSSAIEVPQISLPKGGGAIKGIDEKFQINPANGTASFSLPLPFSPARNGFMPAIGLSYNSGGGNGLFGLGWELGFPSIQRKTDKALPRYRDGEEEDVFMFSGAEDLVPFLKPDGRIDEIPDNGNGFHIRRYRPRIEGGFSRIEKIRHAIHGLWWKVTTRDNVVTFFGKTPDYRITDPAKPAHIFQWLPELSYDEKGNCVLYSFKPEDGRGYGTTLFDANRFHDDGSPRFVNRYLKRIYYCPKTPYLPNQSTAEGLYATNNPAANDFLMELLFDYGEHGNIPTEQHGDIHTTYLESTAWATRHDAFSSYRSGFEIRTARLCKRVLMFHHFSELGVSPCLVRSLDLRYRDWELHREPEQGKKLEVTYLSAAVQRSYIRNAANDTAYRHRGLPPVEFGYEELRWNKKTASITPENIANAPAGLSSGYQWVDLYNEGISGILTEQGNGWFYKENLGNGQFTPAKPVMPKPSLLGIASGVLQLQDLEADGRKQVVVNSPGLNGYFELTADRSWEPFRSFAQVAHVDLRDPNVRMFDINGDGQPEIVITEENVFTWYPSAGVKGYENPEHTYKSYDEESGPAIVFAESSQSIFLADMSGDGLTDIVRIRNGEICYWPNLGYGHFGAKVNMSNSPRFDYSDQFDPAAIQLADISGTGATDLIYLGKNQFRAWLNLSGNAWSKACDIEPFFDTASPNQISVTDLLGNGTACIVWSSPLPGNVGSPLRYIDLMGGKKPHVLNFYKNNLGKETRWEYKSSTHFYLEDKKTDQPWITQLPFPVQVVSRVVVEDTWRNTRFSNQYSYHHGYYDHSEREFRGFGRVEQTDVEDFGEFAAGNQHSPYITSDKTLYQPPVKTLTWFHTGAFLSRERILNQFEKEYFRPDGSDFHENQLPEPDLRTAGFSADEYREALRACKGLTLRTETYELAVDDEGQMTNQRVRLFSTAFHNCHIRRLQARGQNRHSVFLVTESEAITYQYELPLENGIPVQGADPRIAHTINLNIDGLGNVLQSVAIGYPRWRYELLNDPLLPESAERLIQDVQRELHIVYTENRFTDDAITPRDHRLRMPCEVKTYELSGVGLARQSYFALTDFSPTPLQALTPTAYHRQPASGLEKRLVEHVRMLYFNDSLTAAEPLGQLNRLGLPYETYKIALTADLLTAILGNKLSSLQQAGESYTDMLNRILPAGGYHRFAGEPNTWWIRSGTAGFEPDAKAHFYLPERYTDSFGNTTVLTYDPRDLFMQNSRDPLGNTVTVEQFDYRVLAPMRILDPNDNVSEVAFDMLGLPCAVAARGKVVNGSSESGDTVTGVLTEVPPEVIRNFFTGTYNETEARNLLGNTTARHLYYFGETTAPDGKILYGQHPACAAGILREKHVAQSATGGSPLQIAFEYSDGSGQGIAAKVQAEDLTPGPSPGGEGSIRRWITNGKTILNNKGKPVKQYEPYFTPHHRFEEPIAVGVTPIIYYDAAGRTVRTEMPDGTYSRVEFSPWFVAAYDANDTVLEQGNAWYARYRIGTPEQRQAARSAAAHAITPAVTHLDSLGREVIAIAHNRRDRVDEKHLTYTHLDAEGKPLWIQDARGHLVMQYIFPYAADNRSEPQNFSPCYDIAGNLLFQHSMDGGDRWTINDAAGKPMFAWDVYKATNTAAEENRLYWTEYDALHRPTRQWLRINGEAEKEISRTLYGEGLSLPQSPQSNPQSPQSNPQSNNLRGQAVITLGPEGRTEAVSFDFKGNLLESRRQLLADAIEHTMDWSDYVEGTPSSHLSTEVFVQRTQYDALNRMTRLFNWHRGNGSRVAVYEPRYNARGVLQSERLVLGATKTASGYSGGTAAEAIRDIRYDAKGQRLSLRSGNDTLTTYTYDAETFRLIRLHSSRTTTDTCAAGTGSVFVNDRIVQDLFYTYDPVGNITEIKDAAFQTVFFHNNRVEPVSRYRYDALYRLIRATGRENGSAAGAPAQIEAAPIVNAFPCVAANAFRDYTQTYHYDAVGNIQRIRHTADGGSWTRNYAYAFDDPAQPASNRLWKTWIGSHRNQTITYRYDSHGSLLNLANVPDDYRLHWDYRDMIHTIHLGGGGMAKYQYDAGKQRSRKFIERNGFTEERVYLGGLELYRRKAANGDTKEEIETLHLFDGEQRLLMVDQILETDNVSLGKRNLYRYTLSNHLGSSTLELDEAGKMISYEEYHPYGTSAYRAGRNAAEVKLKRYRYTGMERDEESGLAYHSARYYLVWLGKWGSVDPIGIGDGVNVFRYVKGNPLISFDRTGLQSVPDPAKTTESKPIVGVSRILINGANDPVIYVGWENTNPHHCLWATKESEEKLMMKYLGKIEPTRGEEGRGNPGLWLYDKDVLPKSHDSVSTNNSRSAPILGYVVEKINEGLPVKIGVNVKGQNSKQLNGGVVDHFLFVVGYQKQIIGGTPTVVKLIAVDNAWGKGQPPANYTIEFIINPDGSWVKEEKPGESASPTPYDINKEYEVAVVKNYKKDEQVDKKTGVVNVNGIKQERWVGGDKSIPKTERKKIPVKFP